MKKIILILILIFYSIFGLSQTSMYKKYTVASVDSSELVPKYLIGENDSKKDTLGIVITIKQAQKIDNDYDLLYLYKSIHTNCDSTLGFLVQVVDDYKKLNVVAQERFKIDSVSILDGKSQINNLNSQINIKNNIINIKDSIITNQKIIIKDDKIQAGIYKKQRNKAIFIGSSVSGFLFWLLIGHPGIR